MIRLLVVARWPLGGIRTYMKYVYRYLDSERFNITLIAHSTQEDAALIQDARENGIRLILHNSDDQKMSMYRRILRELTWRERYDLIQSQGFTSGIHVYMANLFFRIPHVLTIHGVLEKKYMGGFLAPLKKRIVVKVLKGVDVVYAVSYDMKSHVLEYAPALKKHPERTVVIQNGISLEEFRPAERCSSFRQPLDVGPDVFLFGFVGRFMAEKGFGLIIDAVESLEKSGLRKDFRIIAVGSGDFLQYYKNEITRKQLEHRFVFLPFQREISTVYRDLDAVLMPSLWEACPLQPMEALCSGIPLIASDCIGLREVVQGTPARIFPSGNSGELAREMAEEIRTPTTDRFRAFAPEAAERYDVRKTSMEFENLCIRMTKSDSFRRSPVAN